MRVVRLFQILDRLRGLRTPKSAEDLAAELGVSMRTIYRDMGVLQDLGAPIEGQAGVGYMLRKGFFLPPLMFDEDELEAIILGTRMVAARADPDLAEAGHRAAAKIAQVLRGDAKRTPDEVPLNVAKRRSDTAADEAGVLRLLRHAIRNRRVVKAVYCDLQDQITERRLRPVGLTAFDLLWLLTAWCEERQDFRNFRLERFRSVTETEERFAPEPGKRFEDFLKLLPP
ncbi:helix-turn-helix transcriptional regulator [Microvirga flavescens]|uniref:helix-turn-helix transcriptional regulator n=1 Tax=Microvirga flavescens TaxID=2249811 RepID=UPI000DD6964E|nr:YafY family protein [Microvirga flavescens]